MDSRSSATLHDIELHSWCIPTSIVGDFSDHRFVVLKFSTISGKLVKLLIRRMRLSELTGFNLMLV